MWYYISFVSLNFNIHMITPFNIQEEKIVYHEKPLYISFASFSLQNAT